MKTGKRKYAMSAAFAAFLALSAVSPIAAAYEDNDVKYHFNIGTYQSNSRSSGRYRETTNTENKWKVKMTYTNEGEGTYTTYWLEHYNGDNVSPAHTIRIADGTKYYSAWSSASKSTVYLTAENNNNNNITYTVKGYWDEETGK